MIKIGIDLLWVRPGKNGGTESYIRNLLNGFKKINIDEFEIILLASIDNEYSFREFESTHIKVVICDLESKSVIKRILLQNIKLNKILKKEKVDIFFEPVYSKPLINVTGIKYITTIHDLQAKHYPEYFSFMKKIWLNIAWKRTIKTSDKIIAISNFVKTDIINQFNVPNKKVKTIYNPILLSENYGDFDYLKKKLGVEKGQFYYTVSSMLPHKNTETLLRMIKLISEKKKKLPNCLVISGIGVGEKKIREKIQELKIEKNVIVTGYISDEERDTLYANCAAFLFPSMFEGFGMPPIEAAMKNAKVVTTKCTSIQEVTRNKLNYVNNPTNEKEWIDILEQKICAKYTNYDFSPEKIARIYLDEFRRIYEFN